MNKIMLKLAVRKRVCLLSTLILLGTSSSFAFSLNHSEKISGRVTDSNGNAIPNVVIGVYGHRSIGSLTDSEGRFTFDIPTNRRFGLCISHVCYCGKNILIRPKQIKKELNVALNENVAQIDFINEKVNPCNCEKRLKMPVPKLNLDELLACVVMQQPDFPGGTANFFKAFKQLKQQLRTSHQDLKGIFHGTFVVDKTGFINTVKLDEETSKINKETMEEVFRGIGKWIPGIQLSTAVDVKFSFVVEF